MTGSQLERFARAHRQVTRADDAGARVRRRVAWRFEEDGSLAGTFRLPPLQGAVLLKALRAAACDVEHPHDDRSGDVSAETRDHAAATSSDLADALVTIAESFLAEKVAEADDPEVYQLVVHVGTDALPTGELADVSAETPGDPADPARCHVEDGPAISVSTAQMLGCTAALSWILHDKGEPPDKHTYPPEKEPRRPTLTGVDVIAAIQQQCREHQPVSTRLSDAALARQPIGGRQRIRVIRS
jgi:hypothetical protein